MTVETAARALLYPANRPMIGVQEPANEESRMRCAPVGFGTASTWRQRSLHILFDGKTPSRHPKVMTAS
jgi:hypothetical protein